MTKKLLLLLAVLPFFLQASHAQQLSPSAKIEVHFDQPAGQLPPVWNFFGYDEPNYTYAPNGQKLLRELHDLSPVPVYVRTHNLLTTGDGSASLKWGSTNAYTLDASGNAVYSWTIVDQIFDTFRDIGVKPLVEIGFVPKALSTHPDPYRHHFPDGSIYTGWAYPPADYAAWAELVFQFVHHLRERYGDAETRTWLWEVWNEPDIDYWKGTPDEYFQLYDYSVDAVLRAFPQARVGGPDSTGPANPKAADFLRKFLAHCAHGKNYANGKTGARLDFISFHPKGSPKWLGDHVQMGLARQLAAIQAGFQIVASFPEYQHALVVLGESDPEGCAACSARANPQNAYRNGPLYAAYEAEAINDTYALAAQQHVNLLGSVTWAFEFEGQPYFEGLRELATNGLDKPVLNTFRLFGLLSNERVELTSSAALSLDDLVTAGVRSQPDINAIATRTGHQLTILLWNYHDDDLPVPDAAIDLTIDRLPASATQGLLEHFRVDAQHSNSFAVWQDLGSPQSPTPEQFQRLETAGQLQLLTSPTHISLTHGIAHLQFILPRNAVSLLRITW